MQGICHDSTSVIAVRKQMVKLIYPGRKKMMAGNSCRIHRKLFFNKVLRPILGILFAYWLANSSNCSLINV